MLISKRWQSKTALILALGMTSTAVVPMLISTPALGSSQSYKSGLLLSQSSTGVVQAGTTIPVRYRKEKIIVKPDETAKIDLTVAENITSNRGTVVIPEGTRIRGELRPADGGSQFVARELILQNRKKGLPIKASSEVVTDTETLTEKSSPDILKGAAIGAAAGAVLAEIFGGINLGEVLAGAGVGAIATTVFGGKKEKEVEVVVVRPERDLALTLEEDLVVRR